MTITSIAKTKELVASILNELGFTINQITAEDQYHVSEVESKTENYKNRNQLSLRHEEMF